MKFWKKSKCVYSPTDLMTLSTSIKYAVDKLVDNGVRHHVEYGSRPSRQTAVVVLVTQDDFRREYRTHPIYLDGDRSRIPVYFPTSAITGKPEDAGSQLGMYLELH
jgi:hypothetical protein